MSLKHKAILVLLAVVQTANVWAADKDMQPGMVALGPFDLIPLLSFRERYSDNIFYNDLNRKASLITQIQGGGELALRRKLDRYALNYSFLSSQYHSSPTDNYVDHNLGGTAHFEITRRNRLDINSGLTYSHYQRGTFFSQGNIVSQLDEPDQYHQYNADMNYRYGRIDARGNLGLQMGWSQLSFDNHKERASLFDRTQFEITPGFYFRLMPKTYLTTEVQNNIVNYDNSSSDTQANSSQFSGQDYMTHRYLLGVTWAQSSKTKGSLRGGYQQQEFTDSAEQGTGSLTWDGRITWSPLTYSSFTVGLLRDIHPSIGTAAFRQVQVYDAGWRHTWPGRMTTQLTSSYQSVDYQNNSQKSNGMSFGFDARYAMKPWLNVGVNYSYSDFQYDTNDRNSTQNIFMLYINATPQMAGSN